MQRVFDLIAKLRNATAPQVAGLEGWHNEDIVVWLQAAAQAVDAHQLSQTFRKTVAKAQARKLLQDGVEEVLDAIDAEIDAASEESRPA
jgi:hypothetical protein